MEKVTYKEQGRILLDNFNITVRKGEVFGLIPVNRYGMDAFLKLLQQNMPLHYGYVYYHEQLVNQWQRSHNRTNRISIIRNKSSLAEDLTVVDNIFAAYFRSGCFNVYNSLFPLTKQSVSLN